MLDGAGPQRGTEPDEVLIVTARNHESNGGPQGTHTPRGMYGGQPGDLRKLPRQLVAQRVAGEIQVLQIDKLAEFRRNRAGQEILGKTHLGQSRKPAKFRWDGPGQMVVREIQVLQIGEPSQLRRDRPAQMAEMAREFQAPQAGKLTHFGWNRPPQLVLRKNQGSDPPGPVGFDAVPFRQRRRAEPSRVLPPGVPSGRLEEHLQRRPIRRRKGRRRLPRLSRCGRRIRAAHREQQRPDAQQGRQDGGGAGPGNETFHVGLPPTRTTAPR